MQFLASDPRYKQVTVYHQCSIQSLRPLLETGFADPDDPTKFEYLEGHSQGQSIYATTGRDITHYSVPTFLHKSADVCPSGLWTVYVVVQAWVLEVPERESTEHLPAIITCAFPGWS